MTFSYWKPFDAIDGRYKEIKLYAHYKVTDDFAILCVTFMDMTIEIKVLHGFLSALAVVE